MRNFLKFILIFSFLLAGVTAKYYFFLHPNQNLFFLSNSDIMLKAPEFLKKPTPIPYVENYIEYPVLIGVLATAVAYFSRNAGDFFFGNGLGLSFLMAINILLAQELSFLIFKRRLSLIKFLVPSVIFFTFYNWEAVALFFLLVSLLFIYRGQWLLGTFFSIFGFWTKVFPIFSLFVLLVDFVKQYRYQRLLWTFLVGGLVTVAFNLRFYLLNSRGLLTFFEFSSKRPPNIDSVWSSFYVLSDKIFGTGFFLKSYFNQGIGFFSLALFIFLVALYFFKKIKQGKVNYLWDTTFVIAIFLLTSKVYSPQFNLWLVPLLVICGINFRKIMLYDFLNLLVVWAVYQYFQEVFIAGRDILPFPYFKLFTFFVFLRHGLLLWLAYDLWKQRRNYDYKITD